MQCTNIDWTLIAYIAMAIAGCFAVAIPTLMYLHEWWSTEKKIERINLRAYKRRVKAGVISIDLRKPSRY
jgi:hypothetical protein